MKQKKAKHADLEHRRMVLLPLGLAVAAAMVLTAFEWSHTESSTFIEESSNESTLAFEPNYEPEKPIEKEDQIFEAPPKLKLENKPDDKDQKDDLPSKIINLSETMEADEAEDAVSEYFDPGEQFGPIKLGTGSGSGGCGLPFDSYDLVNTAKYVGGDVAMFEFLAQEISYPKSAKMLNKTGKIFVEFIVDKTGEVGSVKILGDPFDAACANEALAAVQNMPLWIPGEQYGQKVNVRFRIPISFTLE